MDAKTIIPLLILIFPLIGFLCNAVVLPLIYRGYAKTSANIAGGVASFFIALSFVLAIASFFILKSVEGNISLIIHVFDWFNFGGLHIPFELRIDKLSGILVLLIT